MMFSNGSKKRPEPAPAIHTLLGKGTLIKGEIFAGANSLRIEGSVDGSIQSQGEVTIATTGVVKGTVNAKHLIVTGRAEGVLRIVECLEIHGTGWVEGEVELGSLVVDEGGTLLGTCTHRTAGKDGHPISRTGQSKAVRPEDRKTNGTMTTAEPSIQSPEEQIVAANSTEAPKA